MSFARALTRRTGSTRPTCVPQGPASHVDDGTTLACTVPRRRAGTHPGGPGQRVVVQRRLLGPHRPRPSTSGHPVAAPRHPRPRRLRPAPPPRPGGAGPARPTTSPSPASPPTSCGVDAAGIDRAVLMGHSMGVQASLEAYRRAPWPLPGAGADRRQLREPAQDLLRHEPRGPRLRPRQRRVWSAGCRRREPCGGLERPQEGRALGRPAPRAAGPKATSTRPRARTCSPATREPRRDAEGGRGHARHSAAEVLRPSRCRRSSSPPATTSSHPCAARWRWTGPSPTAR